MRALAYLLATVALASCSGIYPGRAGDDNSFSAFAAVDPGGWLYAEPIEFEPDTLRDSVATGRIVVSVRHGRGYGYSNLWLEVASGTSDSTMVADTLNIALADAYGNWLGSGMGLSFQISDTVPRACTVARHRPVRLRHIMRLDTLQGIERVGIVFIPD